VGTREVRRKEDGAARAPREATRQAEVLGSQPQGAAQGAVPGAATRAARADGRPPPLKKVNEKVQPE
jgi:hypothetical protein